MKDFIYKLLRKSEKYTKTDMVYLAKGGFWLSLGQLISAVSGFLLVIAFANLLPKETYGIYKYILSIIGILSISSLPGLNTSLTRSVARGFEGSLIPILKEKIKWGSIGSLLSLIIAGYYYLNIDTNLTIAFLITAIFLPFIDSFNINIAFLNGRKNFKLASKYQIIIQIISTILIILTLVFFKNLFLLLAIYFISYTGLRLLFLKITIKAEKPNPKIESDTIFYGKQLSLISVISTASFYIDKILLYNFIGGIELATYSIAMAIPDKIRTSIKSSVYSLSFPKFSEKNIKDIDHLLIKKIIKVTAILLILFLFYILTASTIFEIFFPSYHDAIFYSQLYAINIIFAPKVIFKSIFESKCLYKQLYSFQIFGAISKIVLAVILIPMYGILGIIYSFTVSEFLIYVFIFSSYRKYLKSHNAI